MPHDIEPASFVHDMRPYTGSTDGIDAHLFSRRARFQLLQHLAVRAYELAGASYKGSKAQTAAAICCAGYDVASHGALKRSDRSLLVPRSLANALDTAVWSLSMPDDYEVATLVGIGPAIEGGIRHGLAGAAVPLASMAATALARKMRRLPLRSRCFAAQALAVAAGISFGAFRTRWVATNDVSAAEQLAAKQHQSRIAGMSQVAIGADTILDALCSSLVPMGQVGLSQLWRRIAGWKQQLSDQLASAGATYLEVALRAWATDHNAKTHRLADDVRIGALQPSGAGTVLLTGTQPADLASALDALDLSGDVHVRVLDHASALVPGTPKRIRFGAHTITVPPDLYGAIDPLNADVPILLAGVAWSLGAAAKGCLRPLAALPGPLSYAVSAMRVGRLAAQRRTTAFSAIIGSLASAAITTACVGLAARSSGSRDIPSRDQAMIRTLPFACNLDAPALLIGVHWGELTRTERATATAGAAAVMLLGIALAPEPVTLVDLGLQLLWPLNSAIAAIDLSTAFTEDASRRSAELHDALQQVTSRSQEQGRQDVRAFLEAALEEARDLYRNQFPQDAASGDGVGAQGSLQSEVATRIAGVARRLEELRCKEASLS